MIYVVVEELIPEAHLGEHSNIGTLGVIAGFVIMMVLDVASDKACPVCAVDAMRDAVAPPGVSTSPTASPS